MSSNSLPRQSTCAPGRFHCQGCGAELPPKKRASGRDPKWCSERCRKRTLYSGRCIDCGAPTNGYNGPGTAAERCQECIQWTPEQILSGLRQWSAAHDGRSPTMEDARGHRLFPDRGHTRLYKRLFGSWNGALAAAGLSVHQDKSAATYEAMRDAVLAGESVASIAARYGVTPSAVFNRLRNHGTTVSELRRAA